MSPSPLDALGVSPTQGTTGGKPLDVDQLLLLRMMFLLLDAWDRNSRPGTPVDTREEVMAERLGQVLKAIRIPDNVLAQLEESLLSDKTQEETLRKRHAERVEQRLTQLRRRLEQAYVDRLDGKITEEFWEAKSAEWQEEEQTLLASLRELEQAENPERALDRVRI